MSIETILETEQIAIFNHLKSLDGISQFHLGKNAGIVLQLEHRKVTELDFFSYEPFQVDSLINHLQASFEMTIVLKSRALCSLVVGSSKLSFYQYPYRPIHEPIQTEWGFYISHLLDAGALLMFEIMERASIKDYVDLYYVNKNMNQFDAILETFEKRYPEKKYNRQEILYTLSHFFDDTDDPFPTLNEEISWKTIKAELTTLTKKMYYHEHTLPPK